MACTAFNAACNDSPDASYSDWDRIIEKLADLVKHPPQHVTRARSRLEGYEGVPLHQKLGIKPGYIVSLVGAPPGFQQILGELPENVVLRDGVRVQSNLTLWFARSRRELEERLQRMRLFSKNAGLWIIWPKQASNLQTDLGQSIVREAGIAAGMVDFKICSLDTTWSGLRFTLREKPVLPKPARATVTQRQYRRARPNNLDCTVDPSIAEHLNHLGKDE